MPIIKNLQAMSPRELKAHVDNLVRIEKDSWMKKYCQLISGGDMGSVKNYVQAWKNSRSDLELLQCTIDRAFYCEEAR
jgi:hypothetical protein